MKLKLEFIAEIVEDVGDVQPSKVYTEEQNKAMVLAMLRECCGVNAQINISNFKLTNVS